MGNERDIALKDKCSTLSKSVRYMGGEELSETDIAGCPPIGRNKFFKRRPAIPGEQVVQGECSVQFSRIPHGADPAVETRRRLVTRTIVSKDTRRVCANTFRKFSSRVWTSYTDQIKTAAATRVGR